MVAASKVVTFDELGLFRLARNEWFLKDWRENKQSNTNDIWSRYLKKVSTPRIKPKLPEMVSEDVMRNWRRKHILNKTGRNKVIAELDSCYDQMSKMPFPPKREAGLLSWLKERDAGYEVVSIIIVVFIILVLHPSS